LGLSAGDSGAARDRIDLQSLQIVQNVDRFSQRVVWEMSLLLPANAIVTSDSGFLR
jgi:hypothetical protein